MIKFNFWKKEVSSIEANTEDTAEVINYDKANERLSDIDESQHEATVEGAQDKKVYDLLLRWAVYIGVLLVPLFFLPFFTDPFNYSKQMLLFIIAIVGVVAWLLNVISTGWLSWRFNDMDKGVVAVLSASLVTVIFSLTKFKSLFGLNISLSNAFASVLALTVFYLLIVNVFKDRGKDLRSLLTFSILISILYPILQIFGLGFIKPSFASGIFNTIGSMNSLGVLAAISLPLFNRLRIDLPIPHLNHLSKLHLEKVGTALSLILLIILNWWVLWVIAISGMVALVVFESIRSSRFKMISLLFPMFIVVVGVFMMIVNFNPVFRRSIPVEILPSFNFSKDIAFSTLKAKPIFGLGPENFSLAFDKYGVDRISDTSLSGSKFYDANSEFINLVVGGGIVGIIAFGFFLWVIGKTFIYFYRHSIRHHDSKDLKEDTGVLSTLVAAIIAMFLYPFNLTLWFVLYVILGLTVLILWDKGKKTFNIEEKTSLSVVTSLGFIGGLILVLVGGYFGGTIYLADAKYKKAFSESDRNVAATYVVGAINLNGQDDRYFRAGSQVALELLALTLSDTTLPDDEKNASIQNLTSSALSFARRAVEVGPEEAQNWANMGNVYQNLLNILGGADGLSEEAYLKAAELRPGDASYFNRIGAVYLSKYESLIRLSQSSTADERIFEQAQDAIDKAEVNFKKAIEISNNFGIAIYNLGAVYDRQGKLDQAIEQLERITPFNGDQPGLAFELGLLYYRNDQKDEALGQLERAVILSPDYANAHWYIALIYEERGEISRSIEHLEKIISVEANKNNPIVLDKLSGLKEGVISIPPDSVLDQQPIQ